MSLSYVYVSLKFKLKYLFEMTGSCLKFPSWAGFSSIGDPIIHFLL